MSSWKQQLKKTLILCFILPLASYADIYKWVDKDGNTHFSDKGQLGAEKLVLPPIQLYSALKDEENTKTQAGKPSQKVTDYQLKIISPTDQATFRNEQGELEITVSISSDLDSEQKIRLLLDNKPMVEVNALTMQVIGIARGEHKLQAQLIDLNGQVLASSDLITIYMQRPKVPNPKIIPV
ncbi:MAG: hypothetical protein K0S11_317 [Gammaproteobacteria bacterium]|jgi:hypothetical protein|nr:hypothetical protein [Gammaproteobacteria bacterium]